MLLHYLYTRIIYIKEKDTPHIDHCPRKKSRLIVGVTIIVAQHVRRPYLEQVFNSVSLLSCKFGASSNPNISVLSYSNDLQWFLILHTILKKSPSVSSGASSKRNWWNVWLFLWKDSISIRRVGGRSSLHQTSLFLFDSLQSWRVSHTNHKRRICGSCGVHESVEQLYCKAR